MPSLQEKLDVIRKQFVTDLPSKAVAIEPAWQKLLIDWQQDRVNTLIRLAHTLVGSGATFGFIRITNAARELENILGNFDEPAKMPSIEEIKAITGKVEALLAEIRNPSTTTAQSASPLHEKYSPRKDPYNGLREQFTIFVIDDDALLTQDIALNLRHFGFKVETFSHLDDYLLQQVAARQPDAILIDIMFPDENMTGTEFISHINLQLKKETPTLFMSSHTSLRHRIDAVRAGSSDYLTKPLDMGLLIDKLDRHTQPQEEEPYRVLIVDDTRNLSQLYAAILRDAGMIAAVVNDPLQALEVMIEFDPELMLIDIYMPGCTGMELAKVIRQQEAYQSMPLIFLSTEDNIKKKMYAMSIGADDFLTKPIDPDHLVASVLNRVKRNQVLKGLAEKDGLTGLLNHRKINEQLQVELLRTQRSHGKFCFVMLDVDFFKKVNDQHGHMVGDQVLKHLGRLLRKRFRRTDFVGRYGGEEFALILTDTSTESAESLLNEVREDFMQISFPTDAGFFHCTFSCGISCFPAFDSTEMLTKAADSALYRAKDAGRNCVILATDADISHA